VIELRPVDVGDIIANRYRILRILGSGGMAMVYEAEHQLTGRHCALKMVHLHLARRPELTSLFLKEAKVGSTIGPNPHIVEVFDADHDVARGIPFLAMELLEGETVEQRLNLQGPFEHSAQAIRLLFAVIGCVHSGP
jgi:serine/threonine protein kinase